MPAPFLGLEVGGGTRRLWRDKSHEANTEVRHTGAGGLAAALILIGGIAGILIGIRLIHDTTTAKVGLLLDVCLIQFTGVLITDMFSFFIFHYDHLYVHPSKQGVSFILYLLC
jgi:hypothetical protein